MSEQKTVREWGEQLLPEPYKSQFMANLDNPEYKLPEGDGAYYVCDKYNSILHSFYWKLTPQGHDYREQIDDWIKGDGELPEVPQSTERQQSEALLMEFAEWWNNLEDAFKYESPKEAVTDFLNQKYGE